MNKTVSKATRSRLDTKVPAGHTVVVEVESANCRKRIITRDDQGNYWLGRKKVTHAEALEWWANREFYGAENHSGSWFFPSSEPMGKFLTECVKLMRRS